MTSGHDAAVSPAADTASEAAAAPGASVTGAAVLGGGLWNVVASVAPQLYLLVISVAAARFLGPAAFGRQSFIGFVEVSTMMLFTAGLPAALARYMADCIGRGTSGQVRPLAAWAWRVQATGALAGSCLLIVVAALGATPRLAWVLAALAVAGNVMSRVPSALLTAVQRWRTLSWMTLVTGGFAVLCTVLVLAAGAGITGMFAVEATAALASLTLTTAVARRVQHRMHADARLDGALRSQVLRFAGLTSVGVVLTYIVYRRTEFFFLAHYSTDRQIAFYSVAFSATAAVMVVPQGLAGVFLPAIASLAGAGALERVRSGYSRAVRLLTISTLALTAGMLTLGPLALRLVYGAHFRAAGPVLIILMAPLPLLALSNLSNVLLAGLARLRFPTLVGMIAALVNIGLDLLLIPHHGARGAALANIGAQLTAGVPVVTYAARAAGGVEWVPERLLGGVIAAGGCAATAWGTSHLIGGIGGLAVGAVAGAAAFGVLATTLHILSREDAVWLDQAIGARLGGVLGWVIRSLAPASPDDPRQSRP